jgi:hypothetical protein
MMERHDTVPASKAIQAPDVLKGFSGSWAASYALEGTQRDSSSVGVTTPQVQSRINRIGQPGMAEINFRPYDFGTNRHGKYGPSLLGHPVSFEVVGPTAKYDKLFHQWVVGDFGSSDTLDFDSITPFSTVAAEDLLSNYVAHDSLLEVYNLSGVPDEGLYVVISMTGAEGVVTDDGAGGTRGGVGDGMIGHNATPPGGRPRVALIPDTDSAKYEIFRVVSIRGDVVTLDSSKRLASYFTFNPAINTPIIRAVTFIKPAAARLVAVPGSGDTGGEKVLTFVPPERSLVADYRPGYAAWATIGYVDPWTSGPDMLSQPAWGFLGEAASWEQTAAIPVPMPVATGTGRLQGIFGEAPQQHLLGFMRLVVNSTSSHFDVTADIGRVLRIHGIRQQNDGTWCSNASDPASHVGTPELDRLLGFYEIVAAGSGWGAFGVDYYDLRVVSQFDPTTGVPMYGGGHMARMATGSIAGQEVQLEWTLHEPISTLWAKRYLHPLELDEARLKNLIDPRWVRPTVKGRSAVDMIGNPAVPDRAVFNTASSNGGADSSNADPGSLMDLGFRVVFYPAKEAGAALVPDFDSPIDSNEVILDPSVTTENQFIEVDYSAGLVYLSHAPGVGGQLLPTAGILTNPSNPRGEVVLFASFVPFSQEPGQTGANPRVTGGSTPGSGGSFCHWGSSEAADAFGARVFWPAADQILSSGPQQRIELGVALSPTDLPLTGFVEVVLGDNDPHGAPVFVNANDQRLSLFGYSRVDYVDVANGNNTTLVGTFGGADQLAPETYNVVAGAQPATVVLRRNVVIPNDAEGRAGTDYQNDTTYGFAKRPTALRFDNAAVRPEQDGSATVQIRDPRTAAHEQLFKELFSSWCISGGEMTTTLGGANGGTLDFSEQAVLIQGVRSVLLAQQFTVGLLAGEGYVYIDSTNFHCPAYAYTDQLPLPNVQDVLIGRYVHDLSDVTVWFDLRQPLVDTDKRLDVTVGSPFGFDQPGDAHFSQLADAVQFVAETLDPNAKTGSGSFGKYRRIKVIGPTIEDNDKLPIAHPGVNGLIIEGSAWSNEADPSMPMAISWFGDAPALFDLSGCSSWVFRDLAFLYNSDGGAATSATVTDRVLFTVASGDPALDLVFENIRLSGGAHGFFYCDTGVGNNVVGMSFRNCIAPDLTDFAIRTTDASEATRHVQIDFCDFTVAKEVSGDRELDGTFPGPVNGIIHLEGVETQDVAVRDTYLTGGDVGIMSTAEQGIIDGCMIKSTDREGIFIGDDFWTITNNSLGAPNLLGTGIFTRAGATGASGVKVGIYVQHQRQGIYIAHNSVTLLTPGASDFALLFTTHANPCNGCLIEGNYFDMSVLGPHGARVADNYISAGYLWLGGSNSVASGNRVVLGDLLVGAGSGCVLEGNHIGGALSASAATYMRSSNNLFAGPAHAVPTESTFHGDWFGDWAGGTSGRVTLQAGNQFVGCRLADAFEGVALNCQFLGCRIEAWSDVRALGNGMLFDGNTFDNQQLVGPPAELLVAGSSDVTFVNNHCGLPVTLDNSDNAVIQGNHLTGVQSTSIYSLVLLPTSADALVDGNQLTGGLLIGTSGPVYADRPTVSNNRGGGNFIIWASNARVTGNQLSGAGLGVQGSIPQVLHNTSTVIQTDIQVTAGGSLVVIDVVGGGVADGNITGEDVEMLGLNLRVLNNRLAKLASLSGDGMLVQGNNVGNSLYLNGSRVVVQGNYLSSIVSGGSLPTSIPNGIIDGNSITNGIEIDDSSDNVIISNNRVLGSIATAVSVGGTNAYAADHPTITGNFVGGDIICAVTAGGIGTWNSAASTTPSVHNNELGSSGDIICAVDDGSGLTVGCTSPNITGNRLDTSNGTIYVSGGYILMGNRGYRIALNASSVGAADPDAAGGIVMGNKINGNIFGVGTAGSGWDTNVDDNAVSGGDTSTGFIKTGNAN